MATLVTTRLELRPITTAIVEAVMMGARARVEHLAGGRLPNAWPGRALVEQAFSTSLEAIQADPDARLWGDRLLVTRQGEPRVVGSVIFRGRPGPDGMCEIGYGIEEASQGQGYATEAVFASVGWALAQERVACVEATTFPWHLPSIRVLEKAQFCRCGARDHETMGEMVVFARRR
jgi:[ribosomal protein S5]-alanine N-acetyltransferase